ncbi:MAG: 6-phosphogluconolactonase [Pseudomonadota bacterium]
MHETYESRAAAAVAAAQIIKAAVCRRLAANDEATLVLSGGSSPLGVFTELLGLDMPWRRLHVTLSDERWVAPDHEASNERMLYRALLGKANAQAARFLPLYAADTSIDERSDSLSAQLRTLPFPFACSLLGMGEDGHFASLFPDAGNLAAGLDTDNPELVMPVRTAASPHPRISLTLSALSRSDTVVLLIFGEKKREVLEIALDEPGRFPVGTLLRQKRAPVRVLWAP